jgi:hypothetical protein
MASCAGWRATGLVCLDLIDEAAGRSGGFYFFRLAPAGKNRRADKPSAIRLRH